MFSPRFAGLALGALLLVGAAGCSAGSATETDTTSRPDNALDFAPVRIPGGGVLFYSRRGGNDDLYILHHGEEENLTRTSNLMEVEPDVSPDGRTIVFSAGPDHGSADLWMMDSDGTNRRRLHADPEVALYGPRFSPDGHRIAFGEVQHEDGAREDVYLISAQGGDVRNLTGHLDGNFAAPFWSPDGSTLLLRHSRPDHYPELALLDVEHGELQAVSEWGLQLLSADWIGIGDYLIIAAMDPQSGSRLTKLYLAEMPTPGELANQPVRLTASEAEYEYFPSWDPVEDALLYSYGNYRDGFAIASISRRELEMRISEIEHDAGQH